MKFPLLLLLATGALSAPFLDSSSINAYFFKDDCSDQRIRDDQTSIFQYEGETINTVQGSTAESTGLKLSAKVYIHPRGACKYRMQIINAELFVKGKNQKFQIAPESGRFARELIAQDISFQTSKGRIVKLFPGEHETVHILNIKRGILSTLQLQTDADEEIDVNGKCKVTYTEKHGVVVKTKDLSECSERAQNEIGLQTASFAHDKVPIKPLSSKSVCHFVTESRKINSVRCDESHIFRPFSAGYTKPAGAITTVKQSLTLEGLKRGRSFVIETKQKGKPVTLLYGHEQEILKPDNSILSRIDNIMNALVKQGSLAAKQSSAHEFVQLVNLVRKLDVKRMMPVMDKYFNFVSNDANLKSVYRQFILDALTYCGTPTCVKIVHNVIMSNEVTGEYRNMFLQGISLVAKPTKEMIEDVLNIVQNKPSRQAYLAMGTLIQRFCKANAADCVFGKRNPITHAEYFLESKLGNGCEDQDDHYRVEEMLMAIKAIGNAGQPSRVSGTLLKCAKTTEHMNVTMAALDALKRMPCNDDVQSVLHGMLEDLNIDSERRIQTYLTLVNCPTKNTMKQIVEQLKIERSKQVGSFVMSHLRNMLESSDPKHSETQKILGNIFNVKDFSQFDLPVTKFSKAYEGSVYSQQLKSGAAVNGHLVYNPDSFIPKSSLLSMSANVFDIPVEVFEMAARIDGVESIVEDFFGQYGYFPDEAIVDFFTSKFNQEDLASLRTRRSVDESTENTVKQMHKTVNKKKQPSGFLSMKVLGHEMRVFSFDDLQWAADEIDNMNVIELLLKVAKGGSKTFTKSIMFTEISHSVPTGLGLPIKLQLTGSAVGTLQLDGKFDIRNMFWGPMALEIKGSVKPSTVVEVSGQMGVHSQYINTGMFLNSSMFTSQVLKGSVVYREGQQLKVNIDAPEKPIEFFNVSSTPFMFLNEDITLIDGAPRRLSPDFCLNSKMALGLGICTRISVPVAFRDYEAPYFPLSGPASFGLKLVKADPKLTTYQFLVSLRKKPLSPGKELIGMFEFGTPGATYSRGVSGIIKYKETLNVREFTIGTMESKSKTEMKISYHNTTNRFEVNFETDAITSKPISTKFLFFNESSYLSKDMGILVSVKYDWYKFQHLSKFARRLSPTKSFLLHTRTAYWPRKYVIAEGEYIPDKSKVSFRFDANQFNQRVEMNGKIISTENEKGIDFTASHISSNKKVAFYCGIMDTENAKKVVFNMRTKEAEPVEMSLGYYTYGKRHELRFDAKILGKEGKVFIDYSNLRSGWHGVNFGGVLGDFSAGVATSYNNEGMLNKEACGVAYFNDKRPAKVCLSLKNNDVTFSVEVLKKTASVAFGVVTSVDRYVLSSVVTVQEKEMLRNTVELMYHSLTDNELKMTTTAGQKSVMTRFFSEKQSNDVSLFGIEGKGFGQLMKLQATYSNVKRGDVNIYGVIFEGWVNKKLPLSYTVLLETSDKMNGIKSSFKFRDYTAKTAVFAGIPKASEYIVITEMSLVKNDFTLFGSKTIEVLEWKDNSIVYRMSWESTVWEKKFKYGFDLGYENVSTGTKAEYILTLGADYARNRRAAVTTTFTNSAATTDLSIAVNYLPGRVVQHVFTYNKNANRLDASIEFLPKMFMKFSGQLSRIDGWVFNTDFTMSWSNYQRTVQTVTSYISKVNLKELNFQLSGLNQKVFIGSKYDQKSKVLALVASAFGQKARISASFNTDLGLGRLALAMQKEEGGRFIMKDVVESMVRFSKTRFSYELNAGTKNLFKLAGYLNNNKGSLQLTLLDKSMGKIFGIYSPAEKRAVMKFVVFGRELLQLAGKYNEPQSTFLLSFDVLRSGNDAVFIARWNKARKEATIGVEFMKKKIGLKARFDPTNYHAEMFVFYQQNNIGWSLVYLKDTSSLVYKFVLSPKVTGQVVLQLIADRIISLSLQRAADAGFVSELTLKYELSSTASGFILEWNKGTVTKVKDMVVPVINKAVQEISTLTKKSIALGRSVSIETLEKFGERVLEIIDEADKRFDEFDFVAARDKLGAMTVKAMTSIADVAQKGVKLSSKTLMKIHDNIPMMTEKAEVYFIKAVALSKYTFEEGTKLATAVYRAAESISEASIPVAKTALKLAKEFKIRGKTTEEVVTDVLKMSRKLVSSYNKNIADQMKKLSADVKDYLSNVKVPLTDRKVVEILEEFVAKLKSIDFEEKARAVTKKALEYQVMGKTVKSHIDKIIKILNNLPEEMKLMTIKIIQRGRMEIKKLKSLRRPVEPIIRCFKKIYLSIRKHFGPIVEDATRKVEVMLKAEFSRVYTPFKENAMKMVTILKDFMRPIAQPLNAMYEDIKMQVRAIRLLEKEVGKVIDAYVWIISMKVDDVYRRWYRNAVQYLEEVKNVPSMTLEEIAEKSIDSIASAAKMAKIYVKLAIISRMDVYREIERKAASSWTIMKDTRDFLTSKPVEELYKMLAGYAEQYAMTLLKEASQVLDQVSDLDFSRPIGQAWNEMELLTHLERYGLNKKLNQIINAMKSVNAKDTLLKSIKDARTKTIESYEKFGQMIMKAGEMATKTMDYIKAIPKKDFDVWYSEVEFAAMKTAKAFTESVTEVYSTTNAAYRQVEKRAKMMYNEYQGAINDAYNEVKSRAMLVYDDVKDDCIITYDVYKQIIYGAAVDQYRKLRKAVGIEYRKVYEQIAAFYRKYEDKTWEEIGSVVVEAGKKRYDAVYIVAAQRLEEARKVYDDAVIKAKQWQVKAEKLAKETSVKIQTLYADKVKPEAIKIYKKLVAYVNEKSEEIKAKAVALYGEVNAEMMRLYAENKYLTIREVAVKARKVISKLVRDYIERVKAVTKEKCAKICTKVTELKTMFVETVLPVLKEEAVSIINQGLKASVVLAEEVIKSFKPHYMIARKSTDKYVQKAMSLGEEYYKKAVILLEQYMKNTKDMTIKTYEKALTLAKTKYGKLVKYLDDLVEKVKENPRYQELIKTDAFIRIEKFVKWMKEMIEKRVSELKLKMEELKNHPKVAEIKVKFMELKEHKIFKMLVKTLQQIKQSSEHMYKMIMMKARPAIAMYRRQIEKIPELAMAKIERFRADPVKCFWESVEMQRSFVMMAVEYNWKELKTTVPEAVKDFLIDVTDEKTKEVYNTVVSKGKELYNKYYSYIVKLPANVKVEALRLYKEQVEMLKKQYSEMIIQWKDSPLYPIFTHEIWSEIANEIAQHELTVELKTLAGVSFDRVKEIYAKVTTDVRAYVQEVRGKLMARYNAMQNEVNDWLDTTTLEDVVLKFKRQYNEITAKSFAKMQEMREKVNKKAMEYWREVMQVAENQYAVAKALFDKEYPKLTEKVKQMYAEYERIVATYYKKIVAKGIELKTKTITEATKMWEKSSLKARVDIVKKMTVGETRDVVMKIPKEAGKMYRDAAEMMLARYNKFLKPYVTIAVDNIKLVGNEVNETVVFIIRYYRIQENAMQFYRRGLDQIRIMLPRVPMATKQFLKSASKESLRAVHSSLLYVSEIDLSNLKKMYEDAKKIIPTINKYVGVKMMGNGVELRIAHPFAVKPSFKYHVSNVKRSVREYAEEIKTRTATLREAVLKELKARTMEIRKDLNQSYSAHVSLGKHLRSRLPAFQMTARERQASAKKFVQKVYEWTIAVMENVARKGKKQASDVYNFAKTATLSIVQTQSVPEAYELAKVHSKEAMKIIENHFREPIRLSKNIVKDFTVEAKSLAKKMSKIAKIYYSIAKSSGLRALYNEIERDLTPLYEATRKELRSFVRDTKAVLKMIVGSEDVKVLGQYASLHTEILRKYGKRLYRLYKWNKVALDRQIRRAKMGLLYRVYSPLQRRLNPFRTYAMIFGKSHVMTFDGRYYQFPGYTRSSCTYLLARDFVDGKFTVYSQKEHIIADTPDLTVSIDMDGAVKGTIKKTKGGVTEATKVSGLPIETKNAICKRWSHHIKCEFKQGLTIRCNVKYQLCTVELAASLYGRSRGILGTNNGEIFDDFKTIDNKITGSLKEFANSWLVTKRAECDIRQSNNDAPRCNHAPTERCNELFRSKSSPLAKNFGQVDPLPFWKACQVDATDCDDTISHCYSVAAYRTMLRMGGIRAGYVKDCYSKNTGKSFNVIQKKNADIVVVMSARKAAQEYKNLIASMLYKVNTRITSMGINTRFSLISYGSSTKGPYGARSHTFNGKYFSTEDEIATEIKQMEYAGKEGDSNDYYQAIMQASQRPFKAEAMRVVLLFNFDKYVPTWLGPTEDETKFALKYEANASLFVFDNFRFEEFQTGMLRPIGMTRKAMFTMPSFKVLPMTKPLPRTPFTDFVRRSGGLFANDITKKTTKALTAALSQSVTNDLKNGIHACKRCSWARYNIICRTDNTARCN